ncbi:MAG TPA: hypothetical protein VKB78_01035, partial [Pirellulales bacterium]|nr:hypothetical protein [Pirellulales bacterium]
DPSAPKSVKEPAPEGRGAERPAADQPAVEKPSQNREAAANLSAKTYDDESPAAAIPPNPPTAAPPDARRWPKQDTSLAGAQAGAMPDVRAGETAATSPRMRAILIFRVAPPTAAAAPPPVAGPAPVDKGK